MADFCKQCSIDHFGEDFEDLSNQHALAKARAEGKPLPPDGEREWPALCEGCGPTLVDDDGACIYSGCALKHGANPSSSSTPPPLPSSHTPTPA